MDTIMPEEKWLTYIAQKSDSAIHWTERVATEVNAIIKEDLPIEEHNRWYRANQHLVKALEELESAQSILRKVISKEVWDNLE